MIPVNMADMVAIVKNGIYTRELSIKPGLRTRIYFSSKTRYKRRMVIVYNSGDVPIAIGAGSDVAYTNASILYPGEYFPFLVELDKNQAIGVYVPKSNIQIHPKIRFMELL